MVVFFASSARNDASKGAASVRGSRVEDASEPLPELSCRVKIFIAGFMCASVWSPPTSPLASTMCSLNIQSCKEARQ